MFETRERKELGHRGALERAVELADCDGVAHLDPAVEDTPDGDAAQVVAGVQVGDQGLQRRIHIAARCRCVRDDGVEQRLQVFARHQDVRGGRALACVRVKHGEVELVFSGVQVDEEVVDLIEHFADARVGPVDLVDDHDGRLAAFKGLPQHEARLGQGTFRGVHQQHDAVHHREGAFHFAAEVGVARRVHDVDQVVVILHGRVLGHDRDAPLALEVVRVHHAFGHPLVGAEDAALPQQGIHQGGLAVVDVGDDGDVAPKRVGDLL